MFPLGDRIRLKSYTYSKGFIVILSQSAISLFIVFPFASFMLPVDLEAMLYGGSVKIRSIELFGILERRFRLKCDRIGDNIVRMKGQL